jgi:hypothetical protein
MSSLKNLLGTAAIAAVLAVGATAATSTVASADVACNHSKECWHTSQRYTNYPPTLGISFFSDNWGTAHRSDTRYHWRADQSDDHGYYNHSVWHPFSK